MNLVKLQIETWFVTERPVTPDVGSLNEEFSWLLENPIVMATNNASTENQLGVRKDLQHEYLGLLKN